MYIRYVQTDGEAPPRYTCSGSSMPHSTTNSSSPSIRSPSSMSTHSTSSPLPWTPSNALGQTSNVQLITKTTYPARATTCRGRGRTYERRAGLKYDAWPPCWGLRRRRVPHAWPNIAPRLHGVNISRSARRPRTTTTAPWGTCSIAPTTGMHPGNHVQFDCVVV